MTCEQPELDILAYLTDELDAGEAAKVRDHLKRCPDCAAEAAELRSISRHLSTRLKEIPPALAVPPLVTARIERALQAERRQAKRRPFWPGLGVAAAAAAAVLVTFGFQPDLAENVAELPVVGVVATPFVQPDYEVQLATVPPSPAASVGAVQRIEPNVGVTVNGVKVVVTRQEQRANYTKIWYRAEGARLLSNVDLKAYLPTIYLNRPVPAVEGAAPALAKLYRVTADQRGDDVLFQVIFEAVPDAGRLELMALPLEGLPTQQEAWVIPLQ